MAATARRGESRAVAALRPQRTTVLIMAVAAACLALTGYAAARVTGHRAPPGNGAVSGITSLVRSPAFAAALASASRVTSSQNAGHATTQNAGTQVSPLASGGRARSAHGSAPLGVMPPRTPAARDRRHCLPAAAACVDLTGRVPWPQDDGGEDGPVPRG